MFRLRFLQAYKSRAKYDQELLDRNGRPQVEAGFY